MHESRRWRWRSTVGSGIGLLLVASLASPGSAATPTPTETPAPTATPPDFACDSPFAEASPDNHIVRGGTVRVRFEGFAPGLDVTLLYGDRSPDLADRPIGTGTAGNDGDGVVDGLIPEDAVIGDTQLRVVGSDCVAYVDILVIGSPEAMHVDDDTVVPGQRVTVTAGGFLPNSLVHLTIDTHPVQGECWPHPCRQIGRFARTSAVGSVVIHTRIPSDVAPGVHGLYANGYSPDGISDVTVGTEITVVPKGTLPPTDTDRG